MIAALLLAPLLGGCESLFIAEARRDFPPEGRLVDVGGGRRIQIDCRGQGSPTIVFQAGGDMMGSLGWRPVLDRAADISRACAYSRAGILWSDPAGGAFEPEEVAHDLENALKAAGETGPYVLVGHSRGGLYNLIFAGLYPDQVAGLVFADSSHPDQEQAFRNAGLASGDYVSAMEEAGLALRWTGVLRLAPYPVDPSIEKPVHAFYPKSATANAREARRRDATLAAAGKYRDLRNWPVVVLARELPAQTQARLGADARNAYNLASDAKTPDTDGVAPREAVWRRLQTDLAAWSSRSRLEIVPDSNHAFFFYRPDVVIEAIRDVVQSARTVTRPAPPAG